MGEQCMICKGQKFYRLLADFGTECGFWILEERSDSHLCEKGIPVALDRQGDDSWLSSELARNL